MGNETARARDLLAVGAGAVARDGAFGTTHWTVQRWDDEQTRWAERALAALGDRPGWRGPGGGIAPAGFQAIYLRPYSVTEVVGNLITNAGWTRLMNLLTAQGGTQALSATATRIGVGNGSTAEAYADTDLAAAAGAGNRYFQPVTGAGTLGTRTLAFSATFGTADGNFAWNEFGIDVGTPTVSGGTTVNALLFNRKAGIAQGTKASGQTWTATATITFT
jgi:hypothetical protein